MIPTKWRIRISGDGQICLPEEFLRKFHLKAGDEVEVEYNDYEVVISTGNKSYRVEPTPEELARRREAVERILASRAVTPSIGPLTSADLVHMSRDDNFWYGKEAAPTDGSDDQ